MAEKGRREVVNDVLANNPYAQMPDRSLSTMGVRNPGQTSGAPSDPGFDALGQLGQLLGAVAEQQKEDWTTEGKIKYMQGASEQEIAKTGNKYTMQGWQSLNVADASARWYSQEVADLQNGGYQLSPEEYSKGLMERRAQFMKNLPDDPAIRKLYVAAFDDYGPRLAASHTEANNAYNTQQTEQSFQAALTSGSTTNADATRVMPGTSPLRLSPGVVRPTVSYSDADVDNLALTMLGEAGAEGPTGMAAVAHVALNRAIDGGYGGKSISEVVKAEKQFSTWNSGVGGNNPDKYRGTRAFEAARNIALNVLQGHMVDPTNGATHYYSPEGMADMVRKGEQSNLTPGWFASIAGQTGSVTIGGHKFTGRARGIGGNPEGKGAARLEARTNGATVGGLRFKHAGQTNINENFAGVLRDASNVLGRELTITSGYRSKEYNASVGGAGQSRHIEGDAVDLDMKGMNNNERAALVQTLRARGVRRFGTYDKHPDMLHVDMSQANGDNWFMHNKSNTNLAGAPAWFQQVAGSPIPPLDTATAYTGGREATEVVPNAGEDGVQVAEAAGIATSETPSGAQTQVQELIRNFGNIPPQKRGELTAKAMIDQMKLGNDQLYNDAGGIQMLRELGAPEDSITAVTAARKAFEDNKLNGWNAEQMKKENGIVLSVSAGELSADAALNQIDAMVSQRQMTEEHAVSLGQKVLTVSAQLGKQAVVTPNAMRAVTEVYRGVINGVYTPEDADRELRKIADVYDFPKSQLDGLIGNMWQTEQSDILKTKNAVLEADRNRQEQDRRKALVDQAVANGTGLDALSGVGTITVYDPALNADRDINAVQYGVEQIRQRTNADAEEEAKQMVQDGMDPATAHDRAQADGERKMYEQLRKHDVVDEVGSRRLRGGLIGEIIKDGKLNPKSGEALDFYVRMAENPNVGEDYMAKMLGDPQARMLVETARTILGGGYDVEDALTRAYSIISDPNYDKERALNTSVAFNGKLDTKIDTLLKDATGERGFLGTFLNPIMGDHQFRKSDLKDIQDSNPAVLGSEVKRRAQSYMVLNPRIDTDTAIKMASEDTRKDMTIAGTSVVFGDSDKGERLDQVMGLSKFGPRAVTDSLDWFLENNGEKVFGALYDKHKLNAGFMERAGENVGAAFNTVTTATTGDSPASGAGALIGRGIGNILTAPFTDGMETRPFESPRTTPRYDVTYTPSGEDGWITIQLRDANNLPVGKPYGLNAAELGRTYLDKTGAKEASLANRGLMLGIDAIVGAVRNMPKKEVQPNTPADYLNRLSGGRLIPNQ